MKQILIMALRFYKSYISPCLPASCRFHPTCSSYAIEAISRYGAVRGGFISLLRILRCNPFFKGGIDPVPDQKPKK